MYSSARKYSSPARPKSNTGTMFECTSAGLQPSLVDELVDGVAAAGEVRVHALDDEVADETFGAVGGGDEDLRHAALADAFEQAVAPQRHARAGGGTFEHRGGCCAAATAAAAPASPRRRARGGTRHLAPATSSALAGRRRVPLPVERLVAGAASPPACARVRSRDANRSTSPDAPSSAPGARDDEAELRTGGRRDCRQQGEQPQARDRAAARRRSRPPSRRTTPRCARRAVLAADERASIGDACRRARRRPAAACRRTARRARPRRRRSPAARGVSSTVPSTTTALESTRLPLGTRAAASRNGAAAQRHRPRGDAGLARLPHHRRRADVGLVRAQQRQRARGRDHARHRELGAVRRPPVFVLQQVLERVRIGVQVETGDHLGQPGGRRRLGLQRARRGWPAPAPDARAAPPPAGRGSSRAPLARYVRATTPVATSSSPTTSSSAPAIARADAPSARGEPRLSLIVRTVGLAALVHVRAQRCRLRREQSRCRPSPSPRPAATPV